MSAPFLPTLASALSARREIVRAIRGVKPGEEVLFAWPDGPALSPAVREACRRRVHSAGYAVFGTGEYRCLTLERGIVLRRPSGREQLAAPVRARA